MHYVFNLPCVSRLSPDLGLPAVLVSSPDLGLPAVLVHCQSYMGMFQAMMQQSAFDKEEAMEVEKSHHRQLMQRDMDIQLLRMRQEQELAAERARSRAIQEANMKAMWNNFFNQR